MNCNRERIEEMIETLAEFTEEKNKFTRFSYTKEDIMAKKYIIQKMKDLGMEVHMDYVGNIFGRKEGKNKELPAVLIGSHLDTVKNGGKYDGIAGIVTGIEIINVLKENNITTEYPIEVVAFAEEEGGTYGTAFLGSQWYAEKLDEKDLEKFNNDRGKNIKESVKILDELNDKVIRCKNKEKNIRSMFELHCEQGPTLEDNNKELGIVEGITGSSSFKVELEGEANHAGTTPMGSRKDPFYTASLISVELNNYVRKQNRYSVGTIGNIKLEPNSYNIIPEKATFTMDIRSLDINIMKNIIEHIKEFIKKTSGKYDIKYSITKNHLENPVQLSKELVEKLEESCKERNYNYQVMASGAGHDSIIMSEICDTCMVFVPSKDGRSHCPEEYSKPEDIAKGGDIILDAIIKL